MRLQSILCLALFLLLASRAPAPDREFALARQPELPVEETEPPHVPFVIDSFGSPYGIGVRAWGDYQVWDDVLILSIDQVEMAEQAHCRIPDERRVDALIFTVGHHTEKCRTTYHPSFYDAPRHKVDLSFGGEEMVTVGPFIESILIPGPEFLEDALISIGLISLHEDGAVGGLFANSGTRIFDPEPDLEGSASGFHGFAIY